MPETVMPKVFGVGFQKTGTTSLGHALEMLGYRVGGYWDFRDLAKEPEITNEKLLARAMSLTDRYDAFKDTPWPIFFRELDSAFPGSKFVHIVRNTDNWLKSASRDFGTNSNAIHRLIYGCDCPVGNEKAWAKRYERHNHEVLEYFRDRPGDFISLDLDNEEVGWDPVCALLGKSVPDSPWPHANRIAGKKRRMLFRRLARRFRLSSE